MEDTPRRRFDDEQIQAICRVEIWSKQNEVCVCRLHSDHEGAPMYARSSARQVARRDSAKDPECYYTISSWDGKNSEWKDFEIYHNGYEVDEGYSHNRFSVKKVSSEKEDKE